MPIQRLWEGAPSNRFLAALPADDYRLLLPSLGTISLPYRAVIHNQGDALEHVYFPHRGVVSIVTRMHDGTMVGTASLGRADIICGNAGLGSHFTVGKAIVLLP